MIAIHCGACGAQLPPDTGICRSCQDPARQLAGPTQAGWDSARQPDPLAGRAAWQPAPLPYGLAGMSAWVYALQAALVITLVASLAVNGPGTASVAIKITGALVALAGVPVILVWLYRASRDADQSGLYPQRWSPGWAVGGWFIPVANLWIPYQVVRDIWRAAQMRKRPVRFAWPVMLWWVGFLAAWIAGFRYTDATGHYSIGSIGVQLYSSDISALLTALDAVFFCLLVGTVSEAFGSTAAPSRRRHSAAGLAIRVAAALLALTAAGTTLGIVLQRSAGGVALPGTILGLSKDTSPDAEAEAKILIDGLTGNDPQQFSSAAAAIYTSPAGTGGPWFAIAAAALPATTAPPSPSAMKNALADGGDTHARFFPPGSRGGAVICGQQAPGADADIDCLWADRGTVGEILYRHGLAAGLTGAAAMTAQIRAVVEPPNGSAPAGNGTTPATAALAGTGRARHICSAGGGGVSACLLPSGRTRTN